jgi:pimeloyl-ACP methyl ester carboxylesterase
MTFQERVEKINGIAVEVFTPEQERHPVPILFVHGSSCGSWLWRNFLHYFASRGWTCYALNLRGHHLSDQVADWGEVGVEAYLKDVDTVITWIGKDLMLVGHSMGGVLAQKQAEKQNPRKLVLLHTGAPASAMRDIDFDAFLKRGKEQGRVTRDRVVESDSDPQKLIGYMFDRGNVEEEVLLECHRMMGKESARALHEMQGVEVDALKIRCPVYVLGFDLKKIGLAYPVDLNQVLARYYHAKDLQIIEPGGHLFMLEKNWEAFARLIEQWLTQ